MLVCQDDSNIWDAETYIFWGKLNKFIQITVQEKAQFSTKNYWYFSYFFIKIYFVSTHWNHLTKAILMNNTWFSRRNKKIFYQDTILICGYAKHSAHLDSCLRLCLLEVQWLGNEAEQPLNLGTSMTLPWIRQSRQLGNLVKIKLDCAVYGTPLQIPTLSANVANSTGSISRTLTTIVSHVASLVEFRPVVYFIYLFFFFLIWVLYGPFKNISLILSWSFIKGGWKPENLGKKLPDHP